MNVLPVVKPEIGYSLEKELRNAEDVEYVCKQLKRLGEENPSVAIFISKFSKISKDKMNVAFCGLLVYRMLESQAEANWMNESIF
jgi:hypothetical protein